MRVNSKSKSSGFMLIELAVVVGIVALIAAGALAAMKIHVAGKKISDTNEHMAIIKTALAVYKKQHAHLPCPASMTAKPGDANFGIQDTEAADAVTGKDEPFCKTGAAAAGTTRVTNAAATAGFDTVRIGAVPFLTLGISGQASVDGWNDRFLYAVSESLAENTDGWDDNHGAITLQNGAGAVIGPNKDHTPFVLISMGQSGLGAITYQGVPRGGAVCPPAPALEHENCDLADAVFRSGLYSNTTNAARFDNIVSNDLGANDPSRICGDQGMIYGPGHPMADAQGCVPDLVVDAAGNTGITGTATVGNGVVVTAGGAVIGGGANITGDTSIAGNVGIGTAAAPTILSVTGEVRVGV